jgi:Protein of unknown function (DUF2551)
MKPQRSEILSRLVRFLNLDSDGLRRLVLQSIVEAQEFTVASVHEIVSQRFCVSRKVVASMIACEQEVLSRTQDLCAEG